MPRRYRARCETLCNQLERDLQQSVVHGSKSLKWLCSKMMHDAEEAMKGRHVCLVCFCPRTWGRVRGHSHGYATFGTVSADAKLPCSTPRARRVT